MRVRLHVRGGRIGSFREGTHDVCDLAATGQVLPQTLAVVEALGECLQACGVLRLEAVEVAENLDASQRVLHLDCGRDESLDAAVLSAVAAIPGVTGVSTARAWDARLTAVSGVPWVEDRLAAFVAPAPGDEPGVSRSSAATEATAGPMLRRHARAFFQANRFLTPLLVQRVLARLGAGPVVDLYAGVGLFALSGAAAVGGSVVAVEGDQVSASDLAVNAAAFGAQVRVVHATVESFLRGAGDLRESTLIVDPPRTGISGEAMAAILASRARRIVYVSCDVATMARDARRLVEAGYLMGDVEAFDLFPNTAHVEALASFETAGELRV
jgi:23S rRNA (uracil1939-C5)-methyltransferase